MPDRLPFGLRRSGTTLLLGVVPCHGTTFGTATRSRSLDRLERAFGSVPRMRPTLEWRLAGRWWNGVWGRMAQRRIWLWTNGYIWRVEARQGDSDRRTYRSPDYLSEAEARQEIQEMIARSSDIGTWRELPLDG